MNLNKGGIKIKNYLESMSSNNKFDGYKYSYYYLNNFKLKKL